MSDPVTLNVNNRIGFVTINNPPVNAASHAVRAGLVAAISQANATDDVDVIVLYAEGRTFIAGADIKEFGTTPKDPWLPEVCNFIEASQKPVIAVLHGTPLGGGLEVAMAAHARVALPGTKVGLPEVTLGILPGAGGTQRAPRLVGVSAALDMILSGRHVPADEALELGIIDRIEEGSVQDVARLAADLWRTGALQTRKTGDLSVKEDRQAIVDARERVQRKTPNLFSPLKCVEAIAASVLPIEQGLKEERALFNECLNSPQRAGLIHAFFSERAVAKIPEAKVTPRDVSSVGVIGGGLMGSGIATACLMAGLPVVMVEQSDDALARGLKTVQSNLDAAVARGKLSSDLRAAILDTQFHTATSLDALAEADVVIEAVFEDMDAKTAVFQELDKVCKPGAVLATNTSYLDINEIAAATSRPQDVLGLHFFSPAHIMRLLEVVVAGKTALDVVSTGFALAKKLRKVGVRAGVCDGFIGNRILSTTRKVCDYMLLEGATPAQIDAAIEGFGFAMGPYRVLDMAGLDISWANRKRQAATRDPQERYVTVGDEMCERGWLGRKAGRGYYLYPEDGPVAPNEDVIDIIQSAPGAKEANSAPVSDDQIVQKYMTAMACEGARLLEDGIAAKPIDIDAVLLFGYGFPRFRGGPMHYADMIGIDTLVRRIETYASDDPVFWKLPESLCKMQADQTCFADSNGL